MSKDMFDERERALENQYFRQRDQELIEKLQEQGRRERERAELERELDIHDGAFLEHLQEVGFTPDNLSLLHLVPLVEVAWSEGEVTQRERDLILALAERRGIAPDDQAYIQLTGWLDACPDREFFDTTYEAVRRTLASQDEQSREATEHDLLEWATRVAEATGGVLGMMPISREERECLRRVTERLTGEGKDTAKTDERGTIIL